MFLLVTAAWGAVRPSPRLLVPLVCLGVALAVLGCGEEQLGSDAPATADGAAVDSAQDDATAADAATGPDAPTGDTPEAAVDAADDEDQATVAADGTGRAPPTDASDGDQCMSSADCAQALKGCQANVCISGVCVPQTLADGTPCGDGDPCTAEANCQGGSCLALTNLDCDDSDDCTIDTCDSGAGGCQHKPAAAGTPCDDGVECTLGTTCNIGGICTGGSPCTCMSIKDCAAYDDGNPCNGTLYCNDKLSKPVCEVLPASAVFCDTSNDGPCEKMACAPETGLCSKSALAEGKVCDDGNPCTAGSHCQGGVCAAAANGCQCQALGDCLQFEDGNACNGTLYCDMSQSPYTCQVNPASVPSCAKSTIPCQVIACDPTAGSCKAGPALNGTPCEDGDAKTVGDTCQAGKCSPGTNVSQCLTGADCAKHEDGDYCNGTLFCNGATGACENNPATVVTCPTAMDTMCSKNICQPATGLCQQTAAAANTPCDDDNLCTAGDHCAGLECIPSAQVCQCQSDADCADQEDGDLCNGTLFCDKQQGKCALDASSLVSCPSVDDGPCQKNACQPKTGKCVIEAFVDGTACDDGDPCTDADSCAAGTCGGVKVCVCTSDADCNDQDDGDLCNGTLYCDKMLGKCKTNPATVKVCPTVEDTECAKTFCQPKTGACKSVPAFNGAACDADGNPCTANDYCDQGTCKPGKSLCACYVDDDCAGKQGDDKCILALYCDPASHTCKTAKAVECDSSGDTPCRKTGCDPATGKCAAVAQPDGTICGESAICAGAQHCQAGACVPGPASDCDDADACTIDACDAKTGCTYTAADSGACDDGNICTSDDGCSKGQCVGIAKDCSDESPCTDDACDPIDGCLHLPGQATSCDDGDLCSVGDFCFQGLCLSGSKQLICDDANPCTADVCDPQQGCVTQALTGAKCDDGDACTKSDHCQTGSCAGVQLSCDDGSLCTKDACDADEGCVHLPQTGTPCDDGNACTVGDACLASGLCAPGQPKLCSDANPCTVNLCDPLQGCVTKAVLGGKCDDGNACTVNDKCADSACSGSPADCDDGLMCSKDTCDADGGCEHTVVTGSKCDDGNACTAGDACISSGACAPGQGLNCSDNNGCTIDACEAVLGCTHKGVDGIGCDDGNACSAGDACKGAKCVGSPVVCDDGQPCTKDSCDKAKGCVNAPTPAVGCSDGNACTGADKCTTKGACVGSKVTCNDKNTCTLDTCNPASGCVYTKLQGAACNDGEVCTVGDACANGVCAGAPRSCDDGKSCTTDSCNTKAGCVHAVQSGKACNDGNECTVNDKCNTKAVCTGGKKNCNDANGCTLDSCNSYLGCVYALAKPAAACDDGDACTLNWCDGAGTCQSQGRLWAETLKPGYTPADMLIDADGSAVVVGESNSASLGAFFQRVVNKGPPSEIVPAPNLIRWHRVVARPGGGYIVTGEAVNKKKVGGSTSARVGRLDSQGKLLGLTEIVSPHAWQQVTITGARAVVAGSIRAKGPGSDTFAFASSSINSDGFVFSKTWKPPEADRYSEQTVHGIAPLSGSGAYALVTSTSRHGARTWGVKISSTGGLTATQVWSTPRDASYGTLGKHARLFGILPLPGGFEVHLGTTRRRRYDASATLLGVHTASSLLPASREVVAVRGQQVVEVAADASLRIYNRAQTAQHSIYKLDSVPASLRVGPERNLYLLHPPADGMPLPLWVLERRDPWGNNLCTGCLLNHGLKGCAAHGAMYDYCSVATGKCNGGVNAALCNDGNSCTVDKYVSGKGCTNAAQTGKSCSINDTHCQVASAGKCTSSGRCNRAPSLRNCTSSNACRPAWCSDYASSSSNACVAMQEPAGTGCGSNRYCSKDSCYTAKGVYTYQTSKQPVTLQSKGQSKTLLSFGGALGRPLWLRIQVDYGKVNYDFDVELHTNTDVRKLLSSSASCGGDLHSNCLASEIGSVRFPDLNLPHTWINDKMKTYAFSLGKLGKPWRFIVRRASNCASLGCSDHTDIGVKVWLDYY